MYDFKIFKTNYKTSQTQNMATKPMQILFCRRNRIPLITSINHIHDSGFRILTSTTSFLDCKSAQCLNINPHYEYLTTPEKAILARSSFETWLTVPKSHTEREFRTQTYITTVTSDIHGLLATCPNLNFFPQICYCP